MEPNASESGNLEQRLLSEFKKLVEEGDGKIHRDDAIVRLVETTRFTEEQAAKFLEEFRGGIDFDERGFAHWPDTDMIDVTSFGGDVSSLQLTPGRVTREDYHNLQVLERIDGGHPLVPTESGSYFERTLPYADASDVEVLCEALADPDFNPLLVGEAGTGKDTLIRHICAKTNRPVARINFGSDVRYEDLIGMYTLTGTNTNVADETSQTESNESDTDMTWRDGYLTSAVRYGWVFVADEINAAPAESTMPLHQVTEEQDKASLVIREKSEVIDPHPQFRFVATMNPPNSVYGGTNELNDAFKSRFYMIEIDYLDEDREAQLIDEKINGDSEIVPESDIQKLCELAAELRTHLKQSYIQTPYTTRELLKTCKLTRNSNMSLTDAVSTVFLGHAGSGDEELVRDVIDEHI